MWSGWPSIGAMPSASIAQHAYRSAPSSNRTVNAVGIAENETRAAISLELDQVLIVQSDQRLPDDRRGAAREGDGDRFQGDRTDPIAEGSEDGLEDVRQTGLSGSGPAGLQSEVDQIVRVLSSSSIFHPEDRVSPVARR